MLALLFMKLPILKVAPALPVRKETVELPELGGSVVVRGLGASEMFAVVAIRQRALARLSAAKAEAVSEGMDPHAVNLQIEPAFAELVGYGKHVNHLLATAVVGAGGLPLYSADEWETFAMHHPDAYKRLEAKAEQLSGLNEGAVAKNSQQTQSSSSGSGSV